MKKIVILSTILAILIIAKTVLATGGIITINDGYIWSGNSMTKSDGTILTNVRKPEVVTWGKMKSLESKATNKTYFQFFDTDKEPDKTMKIFTGNELSQNAFYVVNGIAKINVGSGPINCVIIAVNKDKTTPGKIIFVDDIKINGVIYSAGDIDFNGKNVEVKYDSNLFFANKEAFIDFSNWKQGL